MAFTISNPGNQCSGPASRADADVAIRLLVEECGAEAFTFVCEDEGWFEYVLSRGGRSSTVTVPGVPLSQLRYRRGENPFDFTRLYVDGQSWLWTYAVERVRDAFQPEVDCDAWRFDPEAVARHVASATENARAFAQEVGADLVGPIAQDDEIYTYVSFLLRRDGIEQEVHFPSTELKLLRAEYCDPEELDRRGYVTLKVCVGASLETLWSSAADVVSARFASLAALDAKRRQSQST